MTAIAIIAIACGTVAGITGTSSAATRGGQPDLRRHRGERARIPGALCGTVGRTSTDSDVTEGTTVTIKPAGQRRVLAPLGQGVGNADSLCEFPFSARVPDAPRYVIEIAQHGALTFTRRDLRLRDWEVLLTTGPTSP